VNAWKRRFAKRASLSKWFAIQEDHHGNEPDSHPGVRLPSRRSRWSEWQASEKTRWATTASISGSISAFAGRSGSSRAYARTCNKRTASGDNKRELAHQAVNTRPLPLLDATPAFQTLVIILGQPPVLIPVHTPPRIFKRGGGDRRKPDPFQRLLARGHLLFPDANDPHGQRLSASSWRVRVGARASSDQRQAGAGSNAPL
jgi:hypothetical protein